MRNEEVLNHQIALFQPVFDLVQRLYDLVQPLHDRVNEIKAALAELPSVVEIEAWTEGVRELARVSREVRFVTDDDFANVDELQEKYQELAQLRR